MKKNYKKKKMKESEGLREGKKFKRELVNLN
jgi:hypothetical protein